MKPLPIVPYANSKILVTAMTQYGIKEIVGKQDNPQVLKYFDILGLDGKRLKDETAWCSAAINWVMIQCSLPATYRLNARSWLDWGVEVFIPVPGDVVVFWRERESSWKGHVGIFIRKENGWIWVLGGNQGNEFNIRAYPQKRLLGYRRSEMSM